MATIIHSGGGGISKSVYSATTATAADVLSGKSFISKDKVVKTGTLGKETKTVTPTTSSQNVTPSSGNLLEKVTVNAIATETKTVTPTTSSQSVTPTSGKYLTSVTVNAIATETKTAYPYNERQNVTPSSGKYLTSVTIPAVRVKTGYVYIAGANTTSAETTIDLGGTYKILSVSGFGFRASTGYATFIKDVKIDSTTILSESGTSNGIVQWSSTQGNGVTGRYIRFKGRTNGGGYFGYVGIVVTYC